LGLALVALLRPKTEAISRADAPWLAAAIFFGGVLAPVLLMWGLKGNEQVLLSGPALHILRGDRPMGDDPSGWKFVSECHEPGLIRWNGVFGDEFEGGYEIRMDRAGQIEITYAFTYRGPDIHVRELGLKFALPLAFDTLVWERNAANSGYPPDHIGRPKGRAVAHPPVSQDTPPGGRPFGLDDHPWGCNDFRSSKRSITRASLTNALGQGIEAISDGTQTVRCTLGVHSISLKVSDFYGGSGGAGEWSVLGFHYGPGKLLAQGETVEGRVRLRLLGASQV